jgi:hypothetical protein
VLALLAAAQAPLAITPGRQLTRLPRVYVAILCFTPQQHRHPWTAAAGVFLHRNGRPVSHVGVGLCLS